MAVPALLDPFVERESPIHRLDARLKLVLTLGAVLGINLTPLHAWPVFVAYLVGVLAVAEVARVGMRRLLVRGAIALPFVLLAGMSLPFVREGTPILVVPLWHWQLAVTDIGMMRFVTVLVRSWLSVLVALDLALATSFVEVAAGLRGLGVPAVLTAIISFMYRYLYVLVDEAGRLMRAREARTAAGPSGRPVGSLAWRAQVTGRMIGTLFLRTYERSERIYNAMLARGYDGHWRTLRRAPASPLSIGVSAGVGIVLVAVTIAANWMW